MKKTIIVGYGNPDRQDDGAAWHVLREAAPGFGYEAPEEIGESFITANPDTETGILFVLQLTPELSADLAQYDYACFVDAHTGGDLPEINTVQLAPQDQASPLTHHMTPQTCLELAGTLYGHAPESILISVRGYQFGFNRELSAPTRKLVSQAARQVVAWVRARPNV